jgi:cell division protein FtsI (penicillin-binding protein 3)
MSRSERPVNWFAFRIVVVGALFALVTAALLVRAFRLHVTDAEVLRKRAEKQRVRVLQLEARRGMILDRSGDQLAASLEVDSVCARPKRVADKEAAADALSAILEMDRAEVLRKLQEDRTFVWLKRRVSPLPASQVRRADIPGVFTVTEYRRFYPQRSLAAHVVGFAGIDSTGLEGIELSYDKDLKADPVPVTAHKDARGRPVMLASLGHTSKRKDVHLTLDPNIQHLVEKELDESVKTERARGGVVVVMDMDTGEIPALAVRPTYNPNVFEKASSDAIRNRAVTDGFEPGSTFKVFLAAAALELGKIVPEDRFYCNQGLYRFKGTEVHDTVPRGWLSVEEIIAYSSNIGAVKISEKLEKGEFYRTLQGFGFGAPSAIDVPGETPGILARPARWSAITKANMAFGQGVTVNAAQLTAAFAAAVNGGLLYRPFLVKKVTDAYGATVKEIQPIPVRRVIDPAVSEKLVAMLKLAVEKGTGREAAIPAVTVIGKTGTAQKPSPAGGYSPDKEIVSFIGALPDIRPRTVIFAMIDEPGGKRRSGGKTAAPLFRRIAQGIIAASGTAPADATLTLASNANTRFIREAESAKTVKVRRGPRPGEWIVPDLKGMTVREVVDVCGRIKCDADLKGRGFVREQHPKPGMIFKEGGALEASFSEESS